MPPNIRWMDEALCLAFPLILLVITAFTPSPPSQLTPTLPTSMLLQPSDIRWASRWDTYLKMTDDQIHWFSIVNSVMIVLFLSGMVAMIMVRTLYRDISKYNQLDTQEDAAEETGWKLVSWAWTSVW